ncbi:MAG: cell division topological specificity factor MinE [Clostridiales bacterium]|nr:cell division topological specificity factor MinE [Clostridiales bacterium]
MLKLFKKEENSKNVAKERLKLVLIHDKANVSPQFLEMLKGELIKVIKKYMEIDEETLDIQLTKTKSDDGDRIVPALYANIPILNVKTTTEVKNKTEEAAKEREEKEEKKPAKKTVSKATTTTATKKATAKKVTKE